MAIHDGRADPPPLDRGVAQSLFDEAKKLMNDGRYSEACPKLAESMRLDPAGGTQLNLALCHEKEGKTATAWADFKDALSLARRDGRRDREEAALERIADIEPNLARLTLTVATPVPGLEVKVNGQLVDQAAWGAPVPIDPGWNEISAEAPGKNPWVRHFSVIGNDQKALVIPDLVDSPKRDSDTEAGPYRQLRSGKDAFLRPEGDNNARRISAYVAGTIGIASAGVGTYFGVDAALKRHQSTELCRTDHTCTSYGVELNEQAKTSARIADVAFGASILALGVATYLFLSPNTSKRPMKTPHALEIVPHCLGREATMTVRGAW